MGPVAPASARAWIGWAQAMVGALRRDPAETLTMPAHVLDNVEAYFASWSRAAANGDDFRWQIDVLPEELEYLTNSLCNLDVRMADQARRHPARAEPDEGRLFHAVLVEALLYALDQGGPSHAAFAEDLRPRWPTACG